MASLGGGIITVGYLFDSAMHQLHKQARDRLHVELYCQQMRRPLVFSVHQQEGAGLIDALLNWDAQRREREFNQDWSELIATSLEEKEAGEQGAEAG